jgi:hypothetical protein
MAIIDHSNIPPGVSLTDYMKQMMITGLAPIYNAPQPDTNFEEISKRERHAFVLIKLGLLIGMKVLTNKEAARIVMMAESPDIADMTVAEECINQKFSEI